MLQKNSQSGRGFDDSLTCGPICLCKGKAETLKSPATTSWFLCGRLEIV